MTDDPLATELHASLPDPAAAVTPAAVTRATAPATPAAALATPPAGDPGDAALFGVIDRLAAILEHSDLVELEVQVGETGLTLRKPEALAQAVAVAAGVAPGSVADPPGSASGALASGTAAAPADHALARPSVKAPLTGIWYGSPAPGSAPYIQVGGEVAVGQVIGLIEAMKLFNEIKSDLAGRVVRICAESGTLVKAKQPLIEVEPL